MEIVTLQFNVLSDLVAFQMAARLQGHKIVVTQMTMEGAFTDDQLALAQTAYGAQVVGVQMKQDSLTA